MPFRTPIISASSNGPSPDTDCCQADVDTSALEPADAGKAVYLDGDEHVALCDNTDPDKSWFFGIYEGTSGKVRISGISSAVKCVTDDGAPSFGPPALNALYLAGSNNDAGAGVGKLTPIPPTSEGSVIVKVCLAADTAAWAASKTVAALIQKESASIVPPVT